MIKLLINNDTTTNITLFFGLMLACVSVICEALFFIGFSNEPGDQVLGAVIGASLVGLQFTFVRLAVKTHWVKAIPLWLATVVLFLFSVMGTAAYFESRFSSQVQSTLFESTEYQTQKRIVDGLMDDQKQFKAISAIEEAKGNYWIAGKHLESAAAASKQAQKALSVLNAMQPTSETSSMAIGQFADNDRWYMWFAFACLIDFAPLLCFAYTVKTETNTKTETVTKTETKTETENAPVAEHINDHTDAPMPELSETATALFEYLSAADPENLPPVRHIKIGVGHPKLKAAFAELKKIGFVDWPDGSNKYQINSNFS